MEHVPHFDPSEWEPVQSSKSTITTNATTSNNTQTFEDLVIPDPPPVEHALQQDQALLQNQSPQEALEKALQAWYTAGYAAALYHVRSGAVKP